MLAKLLGFLVFLKRNKTPKTFDNFSLAWMLFIVIMSFIIRLLHHSDPYATYITNTIEISVIFFFYLIIPTILAYRLISTFLISVLAIIHLFFLDPYTIFPHKVTIIAIFFLVNTVAFISSSRSYSYRRDQYKAKTETSKLTKELAVLASTDPLTGVYNRREFLQQVEDEFQRFTRYQKVFSLAILDIDQFKAFNDQFGHPVGDLVLKKICKVVSLSKRDVDLFGRIGGDEFGLLLPFTPLPMAMKVVKRIQQLIQDEAIQAGDHQIYLTVSIGLAVTTRKEEDLEALLQKVDKLLYEAKRRGGNQVVVKNKEE